MYLPVSKEEMKKIGWDSLDIIIVSGDAYIDSPFSGTACIGKYLISKGFKVGVIPQPQLDVPDDITRLGEPKLFWGINSGCVDSLVANYTAMGKPRKSCDFTPGGINNKRPDRALIPYTGLIRRYFKNTKPIVLGGIEASLRRIAHYDFKTDKIRRSILFDTKADYLIYGMGEIPILELANSLKNNEKITDIKGLCYISKEPCSEGIELNSYEEVCIDKTKFHHMFKIFYNNSDAVSGKRIYQKTGDRFLIQNPPSVMTQQDIDEIGSLDFEREAHPCHKERVAAVETVRFSIPTHRGCFGGCSFCAIAVHQGRRVVSRSSGSILDEIRTIVLKKNFKGIISDLGGPTANMYGMQCHKMEKSGGCINKVCLFPERCKSMDISHKPILDLFAKAEKINGVKKIFVSSGIRTDIAVQDEAFGEKYIERVSERHVSGQLKLAPETGDEVVLKVMKKPSNKFFIRFLELYKKACKKMGKEGFVSCYFIAAHPGANETSAKNTRHFIEKYLDFIPEQVQIFTPTPSTWATCTYYTGLDEDGKDIFNEKNPSNKEKQKYIITKKR